MTKGVLGERGGSRPSGVGSATTVLHGSVQVEREKLQGLRVIDRRYGLMTQRGSMPNASCAGGTPFEKSPAAETELLAAENGSLRLLLALAAIDAKQLLAQAGIDAKEREAADKLQKLILDELHHRIKNTLATVGAIASQSLRNRNCAKTRSRSPMALAH